MIVSCKYNYYSNNNIVIKLYLNVNGISIYIGLHNCLILNHSIYNIIINLLVFRRYLSPLYAQYENIVNHSY